MAGRKRNEEIIDGGGNPLMFGPQPGARGNKSKPAVDPSVPKAAPKKPSQGRSSALNTSPYRIEFIQPGGPGTPGYVRMTKDDGTSFNIRVRKPNPKNKKK
jgi:hypothetical protein